MANIDTTVTLSVSDYGSKLQDLIDFVNHVNSQGFSPDSSLTLSVSRGDRPGDSSVFTIKVTQQASKVTGIKDGPAWGSR